MDFPRDSYVILSLPIIRKSNRTRFFAKNQVISDVVLDSLKLMKLLELEGKS